MAETANINFRTDPAIKEQAEMLFDEMGLNMTAALNAFLKRAVMEGKMPFDLIGYEEANNRRIAQALKEAQRHAADPNAVYVDYDEVMAPIRAKYGI